MQVHCPEDYRAWLQSMYTLFGTKWAKLYCGPMLSYAPIMQAHDTHPVSVDALHPTKVIPFDSKCVCNIVRYQIVTGLKNVCVGICKFFLLTTLSYI